MARDPFDAEMKTRLPSGCKAALQAIADERHIDLADVAREAFREYLERHPMPTSDQPQPAEAGT